jgi:hypothetical protein
MLVDRDNQVVRMINRNSVPQERRVLAGWNKSTRTKQKIVYGVVYIEIFSCRNWQLQWRHCIHAKISCFCKNSSPPIRRPARSDGCRGGQRRGQNLLGLDSVGPRDREAPATPVLLLSEASGRRRAGDDDVSAAPALLPQQQQVRPLTPGHATRAAPRRIRARNSSSLRGRRRRALPILRNSVFLLLGSGFTSAIPLVTSQVASDRFSLPRSFHLGA